MNKLHETILTGVYNAIQKAKAVPHPGRGFSVAVQDARREWEDAQKNITPIDLAAFIGREPTESERTMASRAYKALKAAGYIERLASPWSDRTMHLALTDEGERIARSFLGLTEATGHDADPAA